MFNISLWLGLFCITCQIVYFEMEKQGLNPPLF